MAEATVRFHPDAAEKAESAYDWYAARNPAAADAFRDELRHAVDAVVQNPLTWPRYARGTRRYVFLRFPSASCTGCAAMTWKFLLSRMDDDVQGTGARGSDRPSNYLISPTTTRLFRGKPACP